jgi:hypothetical protein
VSGDEIYTGSASPARRGGIEAIFDLVIYYGCLLPVVSRSLNPFSALSRGSSRMAVLELLRLCSTPPDVGNCASWYSIVDLLLKIYVVSKTKVDLESRI